MSPEAAAAIPDLLCMDWRLGDADAAFTGAAHVVSLRLHNHRIVTNPMEPRGVVGEYDARRTDIPRMSPARACTAIATPSPAC